MLGDLTLRRRLHRGPTENLSLVLTVVLAVPLSRPLRLHTIDSGWFDAGSSTYRQANLELLKGKGGG